MKNIENIIQEYTSLIKPETRYASFDYCYNYFQTTKDLTDDMEKSCLTLGFYLASWGMYRGSSFLLQKSVKYLEPVVRYIAELDRNLWEIDVDKYDKQNINKILEVYKGIKEKLQLNEHADKTLVTKILLGVFGFIPAFDTFFCNSFRDLYKGKCNFRSVNEDSLNSIKDFYNKHKEIIDQLSDKTFTIDFASGQRTNIHYPKAKIIDMYGFSRGFEEQKRKKIKNKTK